MTTSAIPGGRELPEHLAERLQMPDEVPPYFRAMEANLRYREVRLRSGVGVCLLVGAAVGHFLPLLVWAGLLVLCAVGAFYYWSRSLLFRAEEARLMAEARQPIQVTDAPVPGFPTEQGV